LYVSLDEATKKAEVEVVYARSFYAGSGYASGPLSGEIIGILAGPDPAEVRAGLNACGRVRGGGGVVLRRQRGDDSLTFFAHTLSRTGSYLSKEAGVAEGTPLAYLIARRSRRPIAIDAALKAAEVEMQVWWSPRRRPTSPAGCSPGARAPARRPARRSRTPSSTSHATPSSSDQEHDGVRPPARPRPPVDPGGA
jgi:ethanolamine utilization protein EutL